MNIKSQLNNLPPVTTSSILPEKCVSSRLVKGGKYFCNSCGVQYVAKHSTRNKVIRFCSRRCRCSFYGGSKQRTKIGNRIISKDSQGSFRQMVYLTKHPSLTRKGYVLHSRWVMEKTLHRFLFPHEIVHHINKNTLDDRICNLRVLESHRQHMLVHKGSYSEICPYDYAAIKDGVYRIFE